MLNDTFAGDLDLWGEFFASSFSGATPVDLPFGACWAADWKALLVTEELAPCKAEGQLLGEASVELKDGRGFFGRKVGGVPGDQLLDGLLATAIPLT